MTKPHPVDIAAVFADGCLMAGMAEARVIDVHAHVVIAQTMGAAGVYGPEIGAHPDGMPWFRVGKYKLDGVTPASFVGFDNYAFIFSDSDFWHAVWVTLIFSFFSVTIEAVLGLAVALVANSKFKGRTILRVAILIPWAIPTIVSSQIWSWMLNDIYGVVNVILANLHLIPHKLAWLSKPETALPVIEMTLVASPTGTPLPLMVTVPAVAPGPVAFDALMSLDARVHRFVAAGERGRMLGTESKGALDHGQLPGRLAKRIAPSLLRASKTR